MITAVSVAVVVLIGGIEALGLSSDQLSLHGKFWQSIGTLNDNFNALGFAIIGIFILAWIASLIALIRRPVGLVLLAALGVHLAFPAELLGQVLQNGRAIAS
jgi:hypothetical protein